MSLEHQKSSKVNDMSLDYRITKKELESLYSVNKKTIDNWVLERGMPLIQVSTHSQFIRLKDLISWEDNNIK